jgi:hypothetical protein
VNIRFGKKDDCFLCLTVRSICEAVRLRVTAGANGPPIFTCVEMNKAKIITDEESMTERENPLAVRWDTEHEEADVSRLVKAVGDDFAIRCVSSSRSAA